MDERVKEILDQIQAECIVDFIKCQKERQVEEKENNLAYICSPYRGNIFKRIRNIMYAKELTKDALNLGYTPITTHLYLTQVLKDSRPEERRQGLCAGKDILESCGTIIIGARYGISAGMAGEIADAARKDKKIIMEVHT